MPVEYFHRPVMVREVIEALQPHSGGIYVDGTVGGGGHAFAILEKSAPDGFLYGCDLDPEAVEASKQRLSVFPGRWEIRQGSFDRLDEWIAQESCDGMVLDLGVSSNLLQDASRGFSFERDGPLDMRFNPDTEITAADVVNKFNEEELEEIFTKYGDVKQARRIVRAIVSAREITAINSTVQLAKIVEKATGRFGRIHPATQVFMALRIYVNDEYGVLERGLACGLKILKPHGRIAIITFHSGEDRIVKNFGKIKSRNYEVDETSGSPDFRKPVKPQIKVITKKPILPSPAEVRENPRARSAKLRIFEKI